MAGTKISAIATAASALGGTEKFEVVQGGATKYATATQIATFAGGGGGGSVSLVVIARNTTGVVVNSATTTRINFDTVDYDPGSDVTVGASWVYTVPTTAWYEIKVTQALVNQNSLAWVAGGYGRIDVYNNTTPLASIGAEAVESAANAAFFLNLSGSRTFSLTSGDTINLRFANQTGNQRELESEVQVEIFKLT